MKDAIKGSGQVLVIEDTGSVADLMREVLVSLGCQVEVCATVEEGLAKFAPMKYGLVITDYTMAGINGIELAHIIRRQAPDQLILLVTGSTFSMVDEAANQQPVNAILQKPFAISEFQQLVQKLLGSARTTVSPASTNQNSRRDLRK